MSASIYQCVIFLMTSLIVSSLCEDMPTIDCDKKTLVRSLCLNVSDSMLQSGINFGAAAYRYRLTTATAIELSSPQALLLSLVHYLATGDGATCSVLAECSHHIQQLRSNHLRFWLKEDFIFKSKDIEDALVHLNALVATGSLKLPSNVLTVISSLAEEYGITSQSKKTRDGLGHELEKAVADNNACEIISIATKGGNVNGSTQSGGSLIHLAVKTGSTSSIAALGFLKADLEVRNVEDATPLEEAIKNNSGASIKGLLLAGAKVEKRRVNGNSYLHIAAAAGRNGALQALLGAGLDPNTKNDLGDTPLILAVRTGNVQGAEILLQKLANASLQEEEEKAILQIAVASSNVDMFKVLLKYVTSPDLRFENNDTLGHIIVRLSTTTEILAELKGYRMQVNIRNHDGLAPLHICTAPSFARTLLELGAEVNFTTKKGQTALHIASANGFLEVVKVLMQSGAGIDIQDDDGVTALMASAKKANNIVSYLLNSGADQTFQCKSGWTALHYATDGGCTECTLTLLSNGAKLNKKDIEGYTSLHLAARRGHLGVVTALVDRGADLRAKNIRGWTPLMEASYHDHLDTVKLFIDRGMFSVDVICSC
ncbi:putative ankyrin repeat protein RF_0381 [Halyomorpha halys]|uniref:putative ankyrin repeat protein RF_0381 n=1 Tax=Halyomorpha halys TaxID=286706 RepID=UPI0034D1880C